jgi:fibronectin-binding autotransporter adhesin
MLKFSGTQNKFGLFWGSIDSYNSVAFYLGNSATPFLTLFGNTLNAVPALGFDGNQSGALTNAYVTFTGLSFDRSFSHRRAFHSNSITSRSEAT